jgi:hypothetical protein
VKTIPVSTVMPPCLHNQLISQPADDYLIYSAESKQLSRFRKDDLIRLYTRAGLSDDVDLLTKSQIIEAIVSARDDIADLPPSSPPGQGDTNTSDYCSSDEGNIAEDEETDVGGNDATCGNRHRSIYTSLRRRATLGEEAKNSGRSLKGRSMSMGHLLSQQSRQNDLLVKKSSRRLLSVTETCTSSR